MFLDRTNGHRCLQGFILIKEIVSIESEIISIFVRICRLLGVILPYQTKRGIHYVYTILD